jgi:hypothetical protein
MANERWVVVQAFVSKPAHGDRCRVLAANV